MKSKLNNMPLSKDYMLNERISKGTRYMLGIILLATTALLINLSVDIVNPISRMQSKAFWWTVITTVCLLVAYAYLMTYVYYNLCPDATLSALKRNNQNASLCSYVLVTTFLLTLIHILCLVTVAEIAEKPMEYTRYFIKDYPFFVLPIVLYALLIYRYPCCRMYPMATAAKPSDGTRADLLVELQDRVLCALGYRRVILMDDIRYYDILLVYSTSEEHVVYLVNGEKIFVSMTTKDPEKWPLAPWFVKISGKVVVNMLHVAMPIADRSRLTVHPNLKTILLERMGSDKLDQLLTVSRRMCEKNLRRFLNDTATPPENGWDERITL